MRESREVVKPTLVILSALVGLVAATAGAQAANDFVIVAGGPRDQQRIGSYSFGRDPTYAAAVRAFGRPASRGVTALGSERCTVRWTKLGLEVAFASTPSDPCSLPSLGQSSWAGATIYAGPWRTSVGLRLGDSVAKLRRLYPKASYVDRPPAPPAWLLVFRRGEVGTTVYLQADVWAGRVTAFDLPPGYVSVGRS